MLEWHDVLPMVRTALGDDLQGSVVFLEFLTVLPEEVMDGRKVSLSVGCLGEVHGGGRGLLTDI